MSRKPRIWPVVVASAAGLAVLLYLGIWQLQRLQWKEGLIAQLAANAAADPVSLEAAGTLRGEGRNIEFLKVRFPATYRNDAGMTMISAIDGGPGWTVITPAVTPAGLAVLVDRGQVPADRLDTISKPEGEIEISGIVRLYPHGKGYFDPDNDSARNAWYWWDVAAMLDASHLPPGVTPVPFVVQLLPGTATAEYPRPPEPKANLRNNHLGYAITWFGLAAVLVAMTALYVSALMKKSSA